MIAKKYLDSITANSARHLAEGERIEVASTALVGEMNVKKQFAQGFAVTALTLGTVTAFRRPRKMYVVLTDRRLMFFLGNEATGKMTDKLVSEIPREALATVGTRPKKVMMMVPTLVVELALAGSDKGLSLQFPTPAREEGQQLADLLNRE